MSGNIDATPQSRLLTDEEMRDALHDNDVLRKAIRASREATGRATTDATKQPGLSADDLADFLRERR